MTWSWSLLFISLKLMCLIEKMSKRDGASSTVFCYPRDRDIQSHLIESSWDSSSTKRSEEPPCMQSRTFRGKNWVTEIGLGHQVYV